MQIINYKKRNNTLYINKNGMNKTSFTQKEFKRVIKNALKLSVMSIFRQKMFTVQYFFELKRVKCAIMSMLSGKNKVGVKL